MKKPPSRMALFIRLNWWRMQVPPLRLAVISHLPYRCANPPYGRTWTNRTPVVGFGDRCSTTELMPCMAGMMGVEPMTLCLTGTCSTTELHPNMAGRAGFEPADDRSRLRVSNPLHSTALPTPRVLPLFRARGVPRYEKSRPRGRLDSAKVDYSCRRSVLHKKPLSLRYAQRHRRRDARAYSALAQARPAMPLALRIAREITGR